MLTAQKNDDLPESNLLYTLLTTQKEFTAGSPITLVFSSSVKKEIPLYCSSSYGTTLLYPTVKNNHLLYTFPNSISNKIGIVNWQLITTTKPLSSAFNIIAQKQPNTIETYLKPTSIEAGGKDFAMLVAIPTDRLDNPMKNNTKIEVKHQFLSENNSTIVYTDNLIASENIYSPKKSGRMIISTSCLGLNSKEYDVNVLPTAPTNFTIYANRNHNFADGNQITTFTTSVIKDSFNNIVSDGTFVEFFIIDKKGAILKTSGTTINGIAAAKILHPDHEDFWQIKASVFQMAQSNTLQLNYKKVITDFNVAFTNSNRKIKVGPLKSFMNQLIPDGLTVTLSIYKNNTLLKKIVKESKDGYVTFYLHPSIYTNDYYLLKITTAGITKTFETKKIW
ncbi:hypothetical protein [Tenacibaculum sp. UWU-22]|uniref:hypothetical protein n=1 Tax=Tenacibaculum sp. UWU-22 TaxID=3234187 RepID=UPI0034DB66A1